MNSRKTSVKLWEEMPPPTPATILMNWKGNQQWCLEAQVLCQGVRWTQGEGLRNSERGQRNGLMSDARRKYLGMKRQGWNLLYCWDLEQVVGKDTQKAGKSWKSLAGEKRLTARVRGVGHGVTKHRCLPGLGEPCLQMRLEVESRDEKQGEGQWWKLGKSKTLWDLTNGLFILRFLWTPSPTE